MSILSVIQNVCLVVGLSKPDQVFASTKREHQEMARLANEMQIRIAGVFDWQVLLAPATLTGDGLAEEFAMPSDFERMAAASSVWSSRWTWAMDHIADTDKWLERLTVPSTFVGGHWIIYGSRMHILPVMGSGETVKFFYVSKNTVLSSSSTPKDRFTTDDDSFRMSERLLELGMIWQWRAHKGLPYSEDMQNYERELSAAMKQDGGSSAIVSGSSRPRRRGGIWAFPATVGGGV